MLKEEINGKKIKIKGMCDELKMLKSFDSGIKKNLAQFM
jgi:hypothetical protein